MGVYCFWVREGLIQRGCPEFRWDLSHLHPLGLDLSWCPTGPNHFQIPGFFCKLQTKNTKSETFRQFNFGEVARNFQELGSAPEVPVGGSFPRRRWATLTPWSGTSCCPRASMLRSRAPPSFQHSATVLQRGGCMASLARQTRLAFDSLNWNKTSFF